MSNVTSEIYKACVDILHEELKPAMGCTEPIAAVSRIAREGMRSTDAEIIDIMIQE